MAIFTASAPVTERSPTVFCDWFHSAGRGDRHEVRRRLDPAVVAATRQRVPRGDVWRSQARHAFVASPNGCGWDCHRTWEALLLGCIPLVSANPLRPLFAGLPVIVVEDWSAVSPQWLVHQRARLAEAEFDFSPLFLRNWASRWRADVAPLKLPPMSLTEFRNYIADSAS